MHFTCCSSRCWLAALETRSNQFGCPGEMNARAVRKTRRNNVCFFTWRIDWSLNQPANDTTSCQRDEINISLGSGRNSCAVCACAGFHNST